MNLDQNESASCRRIDATAVELCGCASAEESAGAVATRIVKEMEAKPNLVLCLPTGRTPLLVYRKLIEAYQAGHSYAGNYYQFGILDIAQGHREAWVYLGVECGPLCGEGITYYLLRSPSGEWWAFRSMLSWAS